MQTMTLAFDRSARRIDADGRLHVDRSHITKAAVNPYYGHEIPGYKALGLQADKVYRLFRDPVEIERGVETFKRNYILSEHVPLSVTNIAEDPELKLLIVGSIGSEVSFNEPYLDADLCIWDATAIAGIETDKVRELSCAYRYVPVMEPGEFNGEPYDGRMTEIQGNHLALVEVGRAGSDVIVADSNPFKTKDTTMRMTKTGKALFAALCAASPVLAADSALPALVGNASRKSFNKDDVKAKLMALDANMDPQQLDNVIDALLDVEQDPKPVEMPAAAADESPVDKLRALLAGKVDEATIAQACSLFPEAPAVGDATALEMSKTAKDEEPEVKEETMKPEEVKAAMDAMSTKLRAEMRAANEAARDVRSVVGDVAMDSAAEIYAFALDHMKIDRKDVEGVPALRALFKVASSKTTAPRVAQDSAGLETQFPGLARIRNI